MTFMIHATQPYTCRCYTYVVLHCQKGSLESLGLCIMHYKSSFTIMATETHAAKRIDYGQIDLERTYTFWNPQQLACLHDVLISTAYLSTAFNCTVGSPRRPDSRSLTIKLLLMMLPV